MRSHRTPPPTPEVTLGETDHRSRQDRFGIAGPDRLRHLWVLGKTGVGKSTLLRSMIEQDLLAGRGLAVLDPHGPLTDAVLSSVPRSRVGSVVVVDPADAARPVALNPLRVPVDRALLVSELVTVFRSQWADSWGPRLEHLLRHALLAVLEHPEPTLALVYRLLTDEAVRARVVARVCDPAVRRFWTAEFAAYPTRLKAEATAPVLNKLGAFLGNPRVAALVGRVRSRVDMRELMDERAVVVADLRVGAIGADASRLLGALILSMIELSALRRAPGSPRFVVYVDEFQRFASDAIAVTLSEARKYGLGLVLAHQYLGQLPPTLRDAVLGNVGSVAAFRLGAEDAAVVATELGPPIDAADLCHLPRFGFVARIIADGAELRPFTARSLLPSPPTVPLASASDVREASRSRFG